MHTDVQLHSPPSSNPCSRLKATLVNSCEQATDNDRVMGCVPRYFTLSRYGTLYITDSHWGKGAYQGLPVKKYITI